MEPSVMTVADYVAIVQRRKWSLILPAVLVFAAAAGVALLLPPVYKSTATILIEEQEIPSEYVKATVTSYAEQRLQSINQRVGAGVGTAALKGVGRHLGAQCRAVEPGHALSGSGGDPGHRHARRCGPAAGQDPGPRGRGGGSDRRGPCFLSLPGDGPGCFLGQADAAHGDINLFCKKFINGKTYETAKGN